MFSWLLYAHASENDGSNVSWGCLGLALLTVSYSVVLSRTRLGLGCARGE
jgi:hypothetical protein